MISAVNNVSCKNNYKNLNLGSKKKSQNPQHESRQSSSAIKAIPLATLIAMSPLNATNTFAQSDNSDKIIEVHEVVEGPVTTNIRLISTDGDDSDIEKFSLEVFSVRKDKSVDPETGKNVPTTRNVIDCVDIDSLKVKDVTINYLDIGKVDKHKSYFVKGDISRFETPAKASDGSGKTYGKIRRSKGSDVEYSISKDLYEYLKQITEGIVPEGKQVVDKEIGYSFGM